VAEQVVVTDRPTAEAVRAGQAIYTRRMLRMYDGMVLRCFCPFVWRCPARVMLAHYNEHVSGNHLDVGIGTGYFLDHCRFPVPQPRIVLADLNQNSLDVAAHRLARYQPETCRLNALEPWPVAGFDSVALNFLLHCLPGPFEAKAVAFDHAKAVLNQGGTLFGATILSEGAPKPLQARLLMWRFNSIGVFSNRDDSLDRLRDALTSRFADVSIRTVGSVALFSAKRDA
jgi:ubiquinone/menaquinone biosynthesis C-methylase UbiE